MNQVHINNAIQAVATLTHTVALPECYTNDVQIDYATLMKGTIAEEFGYVLRTNGTHLDNPKERVWGETIGNSKAIRQRHSMFASSNEIRYFWYANGRFTEVSLHTYCLLFEAFYCHYAQERTESIK